MKADVERLPRRKSRKKERDRTVADEEQEPEVIEEIAAEFTTEELQEFLEGDNQPVEVDPAFKEGLRKRLWKILESRRGPRGARTTAPDRAQASSLVRHLARARRSSQASRGISSRPASPSGRRQTAEPKSMLS